MTGAGAVAWLLTALCLAAAGLLLAAGQSPACDSCGRPMEAHYDYDKFYCPDCQTTRRF